jgi:hypothetical protein
MSIFAIVTIFIKYIYVISNILIVWSTNIRFCVNVVCMHICLGIFYAVCIEIEVEELSQAKNIGVMGVCYFFFLKFIFVKITLHFSKTLGLWGDIY